MKQLKYIYNGDLNVGYANDSTQSYKKKMNFFFLFNLFHYGLTTDKNLNDFFIEKYQKYYQI